MEENEQINTKINFTSAAFKKYFANTSWLFVEKIIRVILGAYVIISITNYLGPKYFGLYSYALSFVGIFAIIATLGLDSILTRELVIKPDDDNLLLGTSFLLKISGAILTLAVIGFVLLILSQPALTNLLILIIAAQTIFQSFGVIEFFFNSKVLSKYAVIAKSSAFFITSIIKLLLIYFAASVIYFAVFTAAEFLFLAVGYIIIYKYNNRSVLNWRFSGKLARSLFHDSWPLVLSGVVVAVYMYIDQIMITNMLGEAQNGIYASAVKLCEAWYFVPMVVTSSLFPAIVNAKKTNEKLYLNRLQKLYDLLAWISIAIALPTTFLSGFVIGILYKPEFMPAAPVLTIYIWAGVSTFLGVASSQFLIAENYTKVSFYRTFIGMVVNVILNLIFIPKFGIQGAAFATLISYSAATFSLIFNKKTRYQTIMMVKSILFINLFKLVAKQWQSR